MRKHGRSENPKIVRKVCNSESEKIGSRVFPFRSPPASMPSVETRRSTRVCVPKTVSKVVDGDLAARVLRSGKRFPLSKAVGKMVEADGYRFGIGDEWTGLFGSSGDAADLRWWNPEGNGCHEPVAREHEVNGMEEELPNSVMKEEAPSGKMFGLLYSRKNGWHEPVVPEHKVDWTDEELPNSVMKEPIVPEHKVDWMEEELPNSVMKEAASSGKMFGILYSRKRRRSQLGGSCSLSCQPGHKELKNRRYGICFVRKHRLKKAKLSPLADEVSKRAEIQDRELKIAEDARNFAEKAGIPEHDRLLGSAGHLVLVVFVESSHSASLCWFSCFLASVLSGMRRMRVRLFEFLSFLFSTPIASVFSKHGIHFLPVGPWKTKDSSRNALLGSGICTLFGAQLVVPLVSVNFSALPFYFRSLHLSLFLCSLYLPNALVRYLTGLFTRVSMGISVEERVSLIAAETGISGMEVIPYVSPSVKRNDVVCVDEMAHVRKVVHINEAVPVVETPQSAASSVAIIHNVNFQRHQKKRSSLRSARVANPSLLNSRRNTLRRVPFLKANSATKALPFCDGMVEPVHEKPFAACLGNFPVREDTVLSPAVSSQKQRKSSRKNHAERIKEPKLTLAEEDQNIDSIRCNANILVIESDRCWREDGAEVMLESSGSNEWCLAVKVQGTTRYLHNVQKAQETKSSLSNRYTHAMMWTAENGWKLEFCDKRDWIVFKDLYRECCERNVRIIPVPGVWEVPGYDESIISSFMRPEFYIKTVNDEAVRALMSENANYDMDSGDEEWLQQLNSSPLDGDCDGLGHISEDNFEKIISSFEKVAYGHPDVVPDHDRAVSLCLDLGKKDMVAAVFDYWLRKRKHNCSALVKVFQGPPQRKVQLTQKPFLRKKRSFKRQGSHSGRGKPEIFLQVGAKQEAVRRVQEAESAACRAVEAAIRLRGRAQMLMTNADLVTYKSVVALRLAEAIRVSNDSDLTSLLG